MSFPLKKIVVTSCFSVVAAGGYEFMKNYLSCQRHDDGTHKGH